jgi:hypothetical protein
MPTCCPVQAAVQLGTSRGAAHTAGAATRHTRQLRSALLLPEAAGTPAHQHRHARGQKGFQVSLSFKGPDSSMQGGVPCRQCPLSVVSMGADVPPRCAHNRLVFLVVCCGQVAVVVVPENGNPPLPPLNCAKCAQVQHTKPHSTPNHFTAWPYSQHSTAQHGTPQDSTHHAHLAAWLLCCLRLCLGQATDGSTRGTCSTHTTNSSLSCRWGALLWFDHLL